MYNPGIELLFPPRVISSLRELREEAWREMVNEAVACGSDSLEEKAFVLVMVRLCNCVTCSSDSYRAMSGCTVCSKQALKRFRESDEALVVMYRTAKIEVKKNMVHS